jgi:hypothetical protein
MEHIITASRTDMPVIVTLFTTIKHFMWLVLTPLPVITLRIGTFIISSKGLEFRDRGSVLRHARGNS